MFGHRRGDLLTGLSSLRTLSRRHLLAVLVVTNTRRGGSVAPTLAGSNTRDGQHGMFMGVDGSGRSVVAKDLLSRRCWASRDDQGTAVSRTNVPDDLAVDSTRDTVLQLEVHLGNRVLLEDGGIRDVTCCQSASACPLGSTASPGRADEVVENARMAADSTMLRMVKRLMALSLGVHREQLEQRIGLVWPRPFLLRPL